MQKRILQLAVKVLFPLIFLALTASNAYAVKLKIATIMPPGSTWMKKLKAGATEIKQKTDGRVKFKFYPGGVMGNDKTVLRKIQIGQLHGAIFSNGTLNTIYPGSQVYNLVLKFNSYDEIDYIRPKIDPIIKQGLKDNGFTTLGLSELGFAYLMSTSPISSVTDLQQQKAWVPSNNYSAKEALKAFEVTPIPLPLQDVLVALQTGMVNVVAGSPVGAITLQWHTKIKYVTDIPVVYTYGGFVMSNKAIKKVSVADREIVQQVMQRITSELDLLTRENNIKAIAAIKNQGVKWITPEKGTATKLKQMIRSANNNVINASNMDTNIIQSLDKYLNKFRNTQASVK